MINLPHVFRTHSVVLIFSPFLFVGSIHAQIPAFPGAEGFGANTPGGRGGRIYKVTNLNDSGRGSFREACEASGPRIIVFEVGGMIALTSEIEVYDPYLTIAGQTAPGDGICIKGAPLWIRTHDVIVRGLRIRAGDENNGVNPVRNCLMVSDADIETKNIIIDRCSISWGVDESAQQWYSDNHHVTWQWNIISEALKYSIHPEGDHSTGHLVGDHAKQISIHHNLYAHNGYRNPSLKGDTEGEVINNVVYNWEWDGSVIQDSENQGACFWNFICNYYKAGINSNPSRSIRFKSGYVDPGTRIYVQGNIGPTRPTDTGPEWKIVDGSTSFRSDTLIQASYSGTITTQSARDVYNLVLENAGAIVPRDAIDARIVSEVRNRTGRIVDCVDSTVCDVGDIQVAERGWPDYASGTVPQDSDNDGMPDDWEKERDLDPNVNDSAGDRNGDGYTNIEEYINSLIPFYDTTAVSVSDRADITPSVYLLLQNYPNPFNASTSIRYSIFRAGIVKIEVYDIYCRKTQVLVHEFKPVGNYSVNFYADNLPSGIYICKFQVGNDVQTKKMLLMK